MKSKREEDLAVTNGDRDRFRDHFRDRFRDRFRDQCGIFAIIGNSEAANLAYLGLHGLQHRGQESAGIVTSDGERLHAYRRLGLVSKVFTPETLDKLPGNCAIGHVRYSTAGGTHLSNAQPFVVHFRRGSLAVAHNGNLTNALVLREEMERLGAIFQSTGDTEVLVHLIARSGGTDMEEAICHALYRAHGSYSILFMTEKLVVAARDPYGIRPMCLGRLDDSWVISSESVAFDLIGATFERDVEPGEFLVFNTAGKMKSSKPFPVRPRRSCLFEYIYFARPDTQLDGRSVYYARKYMGRRLADEHPVEADIVIPVPDSGTAAAIGYAERSQTPFEMGLIRSHYVGRTFIEPKQSIRHFGVKLKLNPSRTILAGKRVIVVDDSIVRGTTSKKIVETIRKAGAKEVHVRISSPPIRYSCRYGIDTPTDRELIAHSMEPEEIANFIGADSLGYLDLEGLEEAAGSSGYCTACFNGDYPIDYQDQGRTPQLGFEGL
ncbi:MAG: amidophosphoribosyltransferase [Proteobacteria bacterium]|nr:amidophosphoribosyltransferase [Pseudomonadota bacterium]